MIADLNHRFADLTGATAPERKPWRPIVVPKAAIEQEIARLAALPQPANGRRSSSIVHPEATAPGLGFAPGIDVTINVLNPGESTTPIRRNSNQVEICMCGTGTVHAGDRDIAFEQFDVWNVPAMQTYSYRNLGTEVCARLSYSNAPLLEKLGVHYVDEDPRDEKYARREEQSKVVQTRRYARDTAPEIVITDEGARLRGYEFLVDIEVVESKAIHWPWNRVRPHLSISPETGKRGIYLLYNPATERRNGTTHSFFATLAGRAPNAPLNPEVRGHRHSSVAINYYFYGGGGYSIVDGERVDWAEGDLMLSAPGWSEHAHYFPPDPRGGAALTVQDHPLHIGMESLMWQEDSTTPIVAVGSQPGIEGFVSARTRGN